MTDPLFKPYSFMGWNKISCDGKNNMIITKKVDIFADNVIHYTVD